MARPIHMFHWSAVDECNQQILPHWPTGPAFGRPEDRLRPVPMAEMGPGLRREDAGGRRGIELTECV